MASTKEFEPGARFSQAPKTLGPAVKPSLIACILKGKRRIGMKRGTKGNFVHIKNM